MSEQAETGAREALNAAARKYNYALAIAAGGGLASVVAFGIAGSIDIGILFCVGLGLGIVNSQLVQRSLASSVEAGDPNRKALTFSMLRRLIVVSIIAFAIAIVYQPHGWVVFAGLAAFQLLIMSTVFGGLIREVRRG
jgi:ATP synthase I chain